MDNIFTLGYIFKVLIGINLYLGVRKLLKKYIVKKINAYEEIQLLTYLYKNHTILDFDQDVDTYFAPTMRRFYITNNDYHVEIKSESSEVDDPTLFFNVDDILFSSSDDYINVTQEKYDNIKKVLTDLNLDRFRFKNN